MPLIPYPQVPVAQGVPNVPRNGASTTPTPTPSSSSTQSVVNGNTATWQVVDNDSGAIILKPDTYADFNIRAESVIPNYPIEQGGFSSYNQVEKPYGITLTAIVAGKGESSRQQFINQIQILKESLNLVTIVTPDSLYDNAKLVSYSYSNKSNQGLTLLIVEMIFQEVRQTATAIVKVANPSGQSQVKVGQVSPIPPTTQQSALSKPLAFKP